MKTIFTTKVAKVTKKKKRVELAPGMQRHNTLVALSIAPLVEGELSDADSRDANRIGDYPPLPVGGPGGQSLS